MGPGETQVERDEDVQFERIEAPEAGVRPAVHLFFSGALGGIITVFGLGVLAAPLTHRCCGGTTTALQQSAERRQRCMELGVTLEELAALEASAAAVTSGGE